MLMHWSSEAIDPVEPHMNQKPQADQMYGMQCWRRIIFVCFLPPKEGQQKQDEIDNNWNGGV